MRSNLWKRSSAPDWYKEPMRTATARVTFAGRPMIGFALAIVLAAAWAHADFDHDEPRPHALVSDVAAEVDRIESSAAAARHRLAEADSKLAGQIDVTLDRLDAVQRRVDSLAERNESPITADLPPWLVWLTGIGTALLLGLGAWTTLLASRLRKLSRVAASGPDGPASNSRSSVPNDERRPGVASGDAVPDDTNTTANQEEKSDMAQQDIESKLRFEIRLAQNGEPYFAIVATSNGQALMKSESYASGMRALEHAMGRVRREAYGATEKDRRDEGPIGDASPED